MAHSPHGDGVPSRVLVSRQNRAQVLLDQQGGEGLAWTDGVLSSGPEEEVCERGDGEKHGRGKQTPGEGQ